MSKRLFIFWVVSILKMLTMLCFSIYSYAASPLFNPVLVAVISNIDTHYSLVNSIHFHPQQNVFCVSYTQNNKISFYEIDLNHQPRIVQTLNNPSAQLSEPQHAVFSPSGDKIVVANWTNQTLNIYPRISDQFFSETPISILSSPYGLQSCKPHGVAFSPCGQYLAIAYGAGEHIERSIALFHSEKENLQCISIVGQADLPGIPKGIVFSPDGTHILVSFGKPNCLAVFSIQNERIERVPKQIIYGETTGLSRPEDVKISPDGSYCVVTNSGKNSVTFYHFDKYSNTISSNAPFYSLHNPKARLIFPHGIAFSSDGKYLAVTQFGRIQTTERGSIIWDRATPSYEGVINLYLIKQ